MAEIPDLFFLFMLFFAVFSLRRDLIAERKTQSGGIIPKRTATRAATEVGDPKLVLSRLAASELAEVQVTRPL